MSLDTLISIVVSAVVSLIVTTLAIRADNKRSKDQLRHEERHRKNALYQELCLRLVNVIEYRDRYAQMNLDIMICAAEGLASPDEMTILDKLREATKDPHHLDTYLIGTLVRNLFAAQCNQQPNKKSKKKHHQ